MPFCYSPWSNLDISPNGDIAPCCKFQKKYYTQNFNIQTHSLVDYSNSKLLDTIKKQFLTDEWPKGCERCRIEEENNIESKRQLDYIRWKDHYDKYDVDNSKFITTSIAFGNTCNLKCITCGPHSSSRWQQEYRELYGKDIPHFKFYKKNFVKDFVAQAPEIVHLDIPGGEPFLSGVDEQQALLEYYIESGRSGQITLHYTTNAQLFPESRWWQIWKHFREVDIQLSIDGIDKRYEYIRYPASWDVLVENVKKYQARQQDNIRLSVSHTLSAYNVYYLEEFFEWCYNTGLPRPWVGKVHNPYYMRPGVWSLPAKKLIIEKLYSSDYEDVRLWADLIYAVDDTEFFNEFIENLHKHDQYRQLDFTKTFPELSVYT